MIPVIYVIVKKSDGSIASVSGSRKIPAYTTKGRAERGLKTHWLSEEVYEVREFTQKREDA